MAPYIACAVMINHRIQTVTLQIPKSHTPVTIINTYAPHKGISKKEQREHWNGVEKPLKQYRVQIYKSGAHMQMGSWGNQKSKRGEVKNNRGLRKRYKNGNWKRRIPETHMSKQTHDTNEHIGRDAIGGTRKGG